MSELKKIPKDGEVRFRCTMSGNCCRNMEIFLNPYDVLKLSEVLKKTTGEVIRDELLFLKSKGQLFSRPILKKARSGSCSFNRDRKCMIHPSRPLSCRLFPLARLNQEFYLQETEYCLGIHQKDRQPLSSYLKQEESEDWLALSEECHQVIQEGESSLKGHDPDPFLLRLIELILYDYDTALGGEYVLESPKEKLRLSLHLTRYLIRFGAQGWAGPPEELLERIYTEGDRYLADNS